MRAILEAWWSERNAREKRLLSIGSLVLLLVLAYNILIAPAWDGTDAIRENLPAMKAQLADMQGQDLEAKRLGVVAQSVAPTGDSLSNTVSSSLTDRGLAATQVTLVGNTAVRVEWKNVSFAAWVGWLDDMRKQLKIQVAQTHVVPSAEGNGRVDISATLGSGNAAGGRGQGAAYPAS